ncbi:MAG: Tim44/TimA family putative adaptor protein [Rickettsiales bacterium]
MHNFVDIIFFALIAVFLATKLFSVLGQKTEINSNDVGVTEKEKNPSETILTKDISDEDKIKKFDSSFTPEDFSEKSKKAIKFIYEAYENGNTQILSDLLNVECMRKFAYNISKLEESSLEGKISIIEISLPKIKSISIKDYNAQIKVNTELQTVNYIEKKGKILHGNKTKVEKLSLNVEFARDIRSSSPTWKIENISFIPFTDFLKK